MTWALAFISIGLSALAQLLMKVGMSGLPPTARARAIDLAIAVATNPFVVGGLAAYGLSAVLWLAVLSRMPLSLAYPLVALAIVIVVATSAMVLGEPVPLGRAIGAALIVAGVALIGFKG